MNNIEGTITSLVDVAEVVERKLGVGVSYPPYAPEGMWTAEVEEIPTDVLDLLLSQGLEIEKRSSMNLIEGNTQIRYRLKGKISDLFRILFHLLLKVTEYQESAFDSSFQMGVGIASGGPSLLELIEK